MSGDPVNRLQRLAELHRNGELTDEEFAAAKREVLAGGESGATATPVQWGMSEAGAPKARAFSFPSTSWGGSTARRSPVWRRPWVLLLAVFSGFMFASAVTAVTPSSALWTGRFLCDSPAHMEHQSSDASYGNTSQTNIDFFCVSDTGPDVHVSGLPIFGLQLVLGSLVAYLVLVLGATGFALVTSRT